MNDSLTYNSIQKILTKKLGIHPELIHDRAILNNDFGFNDRELSLLFYYIENHFNVDLPGEISPFSTISDLVTAIQTAKSN